MKRFWVLLSLAGLAATVCTGWLLVRQQQGEAALLEARQILHAPLTNAPRYQDLEIDRAKRLLEQAQRSGVSSSRVDPLRLEAELIDGLTQGDLVAAEQVVQAVRSRSAWTRQLHWLAAETSRMKGAESEALDRVDQALQLAAEYSRARLLRADLALDRGDGELAARDLKLVIATNPSCAPLHNRMALAHELLGNAQRAEYHLRRAVALDDRNVDAWVNLGRLLGQAERFEESFESFDKAVRISASAADALLGRGIACERTDHCGDAAKADFLRAMELSPNDATPLVALGDWHARRGDLDAAIAQYRQAVRRTATDAVAWLKLGNALFRDHDIAGAETAFRSAVTQDPNFAAAHNGLGAALIASGNPEQAVPILERAVELDPSDPNPLRNLTVAKRRAG